jgi:hypothetical protein
VRLPLSVALRNKHLVLSPSEDDPDSLSLGMGGDAGLVSHCLSLVTFSYVTRHLPASQHGRWCSAPQADDLRLYRDW